MTKEKKEEQKKEEDTVIEISHLHKSFHDNHVLNDINVAITKGENVAVFGKSGSGKSVFFFKAMRCMIP